MKLCVVLLPVVINDLHINLPKDKHLGKLSTAAAAHGKLEGPGCMCSTHVQEVVKLGCKVFADGGCSRVWKLY